MVDDDVVEPEPAGRSLHGTDGAVTAQPAAPTGTGGNRSAEGRDAEVAEVLDAQRAWLRGIATRDWDALAELVSDDFTYTHTHGQTDTRTEWLAALQAGTKLTEVEEVAVRLHTDVALVSGVLQNTLVIEGRVVHAFQHALQVWAREHGSWRLLAHHAQRVVR